MHNEEKTGSFERNNIIHVNFFGSRKQPRHEAQLREPREPGAVGTVAPFERRKPAFTIGAPWILRLLALIGILALSLLVL